MNLAKQLRAKCCCSRIEGCGKCLECRAADALDKIATCQWCGRSHDEETTCWSPHLKERIDKLQAEAVNLKVKVCQWSDEDTCWYTGCGECYTLIEGTPESNGLKFCPFCGGHVEVSGGEK